MPEKRLERMRRTLPPDYVYQPRTELTMDVALRMARIPVRGIYDQIKFVNEDRREVFIVPTERWPAGAFGYTEIRDMPEP